MSAVNAVLPGEWSERSSDDSPDVIAAFERHGGEGTEFEADASTDDLLDQLQDIKGTEETE